MQCKPGIPNDTTNLNINAQINPLSNEHKPSDTVSEDSNEVHIPRKRKRNKDKKADDDSYDKDAKRDSSNEVIPKLDKDTSSSESETNSHYSQTSSKASRNSRDRKFNQN